jgi:manganese efflux pump family protein
MGALGATLLAALLLCASGTPATARASAARPPSPEKCYQFAVSALRRHVVVRHRPAACAGLTQAQVNEVVDRAIRTVVGPHPKAIERRLATADSRYLGDLVETVPPPAAASVVTGQPAVSGQLGVRLAALASWLATAIPGAYMLSAWLTRAGRRRVIRKPGVASAAPIGHAGLAISGLLIWITFTVTKTAALAWADVGLTWVIAGLGMATLLGASPEPRVISAGPATTALVGVTETSTAPFPTRAPVIAIAVHGALATLTILLVLLAAVGVG